MRKMENIYKERIEIPVSEIINERGKASIDYWAMCGYRQIAGEGDILRFEAGDASDKSDIKTIIRRVEVYAKGEMLIAELSANLDKDALSENVRESAKCLFEAELNDFKYALCEDFNPSASANKAGRRIGGIAFAVMLLCLVGILGYYIWHNGDAGDHTSISQKRVAAIERAQKGLSADVWLIPAEGFPPDILKPVAARLSEDLNLTVRVSEGMPLPRSSFIEERGQYDTRTLYPYIVRFAQAIPEKTPESTYIVVAPSSLNVEDSARVINFAHYYDGVYGIVGTKELGPQNTTLFRRRLYKMIKRSIGVQHYKYKASLVPRSLMYSPVNTTVDMDRMSYEY